VLAFAEAKLYHANFASGSSPSSNLNQNDWKYFNQRGKIVFGRDSDEDEAETGNENDEGRNGIEDGGEEGKSKNHRFWFRLLDKESDRVIWLFEIPDAEGGFEYRMDKPFFHAFSGRSRMWGFVFDNDEEGSVFGKVVQSHIGGKPETQNRTRRPLPNTNTRGSRVSRSMISLPEISSFVHVSHIGFDKYGFFEWSEGIDPAWIEVLGELEG
ncbi:hypothetical protein K435DRAFT_619392, partial [Dendrothele bispora CBS 962.96]